MRVDTFKKVRDLSMVAAFGVIDRKDIQKGCNLFGLVSF